MRQLIEPTQKNVLRPTLIFGIPFAALLLLALAVMAVQLVGGGSVAANIVSVVAGVFGFGALRLLARFGKTGWDESLVFALEWLLARRRTGSWNPGPSQRLSVTPFDTLDERDLIQGKEEISAPIQDLKPGERLCFSATQNQDGRALEQFKPDLNTPLFVPRLKPWRIKVYLKQKGLETCHIYSLHQLPAYTDPLWLCAILERVSSVPFRVYTSFRGVDQHRAKKWIESSRKRSAKGETAVSEIDCDVTFDEATQVAESLSRGTDRLVQASLVLMSSHPLDLDPSLFVEETRPWLKALAYLSSTGQRKRLHRSFLVRVPTATDLIPSVGDPMATLRPLLTTRRGCPLYLDFQDPAFSALHMNINGATGVGKSVFIAAILNRMSEGSPMSVLFVDHLRSYRRLVRSKGGEFSEPRSVDELNRALPRLLAKLLTSGRFQGVELSELPEAEKKEAVRLLLSSFERFLKTRPEHFPVYLVMDECWSILKNEPILVQRAFREFRKLDGAAVAITQSLADLLKEENGQAIFQNSPIQIILRQREDPAKYTGDLGLNTKEIEIVRSLRQERGRYSECLIKTPFYSRVGRLELTPEEHELYRTDTVRREVVAERLQAQEVAHA